MAEVMSVASGGLIRKGIVVSALLSLGLLAVVEVRCHFRKTIMCHVFNHIIMHILFICRFSVTKKLFYTLI